MNPIKTTVSLNRTTDKVVKSVGNVLRNEGSVTFDPKVPVLTATPSSDSCILSVGAVTYGNDTIHYRFLNDSYEVVSDWSANTSVVISGLEDSITYTFYAQSKNVRNGKISGYSNSVEVETVEENYTTSISQNGITWTFSEPVQYGQFCNGDYWVVPKEEYNYITITDITPKCKIAQTGDVDYKNTQFLVGSIIHGSMINPPADLYKQGYNNLGYYNNRYYDSSLNVAYKNNISISVDNPLVVYTDSSLISTESQMRPLDAGGGDENTYCWKAQILTVLSRESLLNLPSGSNSIQDCFRPHYFGRAVSQNQQTKKGVLYSKNNLDYSILQNLSIQSSYLLGSETLNSVTDAISRPWIRMGYGTFTDNILPRYNMRAYYFVRDEVSALIFLNSNVSNELKENLYINFVQRGIDSFGNHIGFDENGIPIVVGYGNPPDGGIFCGEMSFKAVFGLALNDNIVNNFGSNIVWDMLFSKAGDYLYSAKPSGGNYGPTLKFGGIDNKPSDYHYIQEFCQTFYVTQMDVDVTNNLVSGVSWTPDDRTSPNLPYEESELNMPEWAIRHSTEMNTSDACINSNYRSFGSTNSRAYATEAVYLRAMGLKPLLNHNAYFDYADRWGAYKNYLDYVNIRKLYVEDWENKVYFYGAMVRHNGEIYKCNVLGDSLLINGKTNSEPGINSDWVLID